MVINGKDIAFKISRKKDAANFETAVRNMQKKETEIQTMDKDSLGAVLQALEDMFRHFFVTTTGVDVVGDCDDIEEMKDMYNTFLKEVEKQRKSFVSPFSPARIK